MSEDDLTGLIAAVAALQVEVRHLAASNERLAEVNEALVSRVSGIEAAEAKRRAFLAGAKWAFATMWAAAGGVAALGLQWLAKKLGAG